MKRRTMLAAPALPLFSASKVAHHPRTFEIWDVFSRERLLGNPLAVFPNATLLPDAQLGAIAREMAHSETTFLYPRNPILDAREGVRSRIFSRSGVEMPFAGHPVLGTAFHLHALKPAGKVILLLPAGPIPVTFRRLSDETWEGEMTQPEPVFAETHDVSRLATLLGLTPQDFDGELPLQNVSTGRPNVLVLLKAADGLRRASLDWRALDAYFSDGDRERGVYLLTRTTGGFHARKPTRLGDDPVTGSAAGSAIAALVKHGLVKPGQRVAIEQGAEVQRKGELFASAELDRAKVTNVKVGGQAVCSARGTLLF